MLHYFSGSVKGFLAGLPQCGQAMSPQAVLTRSSGSFSGLSLHEQATPRFSISSGISISILELVCGGGPRLIRPHWFRLCAVMLVWLCHGCHRQLAFVVGVSDVLEPNRVRTALLPLTRFLHGLHGFGVVHYLAVYPYQWHFVSALE